MKCGNVIHQVLWKKTSSGISQSVIHNFYPQAGSRNLWITGPSASMYKGTIDLIIFDGKFDRLCPMSSWPCTYGLPRATTRQRGHLTRDQMPTTSSASRVPRLAG